MRVRSTSVNPHPVDGISADGTNVLFDLWLTSRAVTGKLDVALAGTGITADEFGIYSVLTASETTTPTELARWMSAPPTTVSSFVKRLEQRGHLTRHRNPADGRSVQLRLTAAGRQTHAEATRAFAPVLAQVVDQLGTRVGAVRRSLDQLRTATEAESDDAD